MLLNKELSIVTTTSTQKITKIEFQQDLERILEQEQKSKTYTSKSNTSESVIRCFVLDARD